MKISPLEKWIHQKINCSTQRLSRSALETYQLERINTTLDYAKRNSPFYSNTLSGVQLPVTSLLEFSTIPFSTSTDIRNDPNRFVCVSQNEISRIVTLDTSGTTGQPKRCFFTPDDQDLTIDFFGVGMSTLVSMGDRVLILIPDRTSGSVGDLLYRGLERIGVYPFKHGPVTDLAETLKTIHRHNINCLVGAPVQILALVRYQKVNPQKYPVKIKSILLSTDYFPKIIKSILQNAWHCEVFDHYGTTEMGLGGGVFCDAQYGFHLREADMYFEIVDPLTGNPQPDGTSGEVVFTTLTRRGMPLIRYKTGDYSRFLVSPCPCGTHLKSLEKIAGRIDQHFTINGKKFLIGQVDEAIFSLEGLVNYQLRVVHGKVSDQLVFTLYFVSPVTQFSMNAMLLALSEYGIHLDAKSISLTLIEGYPPELWSLRKRKVHEEYI